jgi:hypothetical protein
MAQKMFATGDPALTLEQKRQFIRDLCTAPPDLADAAMVVIYRGIDRMAEGLRRAGEITDDLRTKVEELVGKLWFPATFLGFHGDPAEKRALVSHGTTPRVVGIWDDVPIASLAKGCEVMLNHELTAIVAKSSRPCRPTGEIVTVVEKTPRGTLIIRSHEEEQEIELAAALAKVEFRPGDRVRWDANAAMAYELVEQPQQRRFLLGETPNVSMSDVGGQRANLTKLYCTLASVLLAQQKAAEYGFLDGRCSMLRQDLDGARGGQRNLPQKRQGGAVLCRSPQ